MKSSKRSRKAPERASALFCQRQALRHDKYLTYFNLLAGIVAAILAVNYFELYVLSQQYLHVFTINNYTVALSAGFVGFLYLRRQTETIENSIWPAHAPAWLRTT